MIVEVGVANARRFSSKVSAADHLANGCGVHKNTHARAPVVSEMHMAPTRLGNLHSGIFNFQGLGNGAEHGHEVMHKWKKGGLPAAASPCHQMPGAASPSLCGGARERRSEISRFKIKRFDHQKLTIIRVYSLLKETKGPK